MKEINKILPNLNKEIKRFENDIDDLLSSSIIPVELLKKRLNYKGLYFLIKKSDNYPVYIGKSNKLLSKRIYNLLHSHRNHTLNKKLLRIEWKKKTGKWLENIHKYKVEELKLMLLEYNLDWLTMKKGVNKKIKDHYVIKCKRINNSKYLSQIEHFAIAIFNPLYNDEVEK